MLNIWDKMKNIYLDGGSKYLTVKERKQCAETIETKKIRKSIKVMKIIRNIIKGLKNNNTTSIDYKNINKQ